MSLFHRHKWEVVGENHVFGAMEAHGNFKFGGGLWSEEAADALYGYTLISQKCSECGAVTTVKVTGKFKGGEK